jgi:hypothetical protein
MPLVLLLPLPNQVKLISLSLDLNLMEIGYDFSLCLISCICYNSLLLLSEQGNITFRMNYSNKLGILKISCAWMPTHEIP